MLPSSSFPLLLTLICIVMTIWLQLSSSGVNGQLVTVCDGGNWTASTLASFTPCTIIDGNITIAADVTSSMLQLPLLQSITGWVSLSAAGSLLTNFTGLRSLTSIGGFFFIQGAPLTSFAGLESLTTIGGGFTIANCDRLVDLTGLSSLRTVGDGVNGMSVRQCAGFLSFNLPTLTTHNGVFSIGLNFALVNFTMPPVTRLAGFFYSLNTATVAIVAPSLVFLDGDLNIQYGNKMSQISFPNLQTVQQLYIYEMPLLTKALDFPSLQSVDDILLQGVPVTTITGFPNVQSLSRGFSISSMNYLQNITAFTNLTSIAGGFTVQNCGGNSPQGLNLTNFNQVTRVLGFLVANSKIADFGSWDALQTVDTQFSISSVTGSGITGALTSFQNIMSIGGLLTLANTAGPSSINTWHRAVNISSIQIRNNPTITAIQAFDSLVRAGGINIGISPLCTQVPTFPSLLYYTGLILERLAITSVSGFDQITELPSGDISLLTLPQLLTIDGFTRMSTLYTVTIRNCTSLTTVTAWPRAITARTLNLQWNPAWTTMTGLTRLTTLTGSLVMQGNMMLPSPTAWLYSLQTIMGNLTIILQPLWQSMTGFDSLRYIGNDLQLETNAAMTTTYGLDRLTYVDRIFFINNQRLQSLRLISLRNTSSLYIRSNPMLANLTGLLNLQAVYNRLTIVGSPALQSIDGLFGLKQVGTLVLNLTNINSIAGLCGLTTMTNIPQLYIPGVSCDALIAVGNNNNQTSSRDNFLGSGNSRVSATGCDPIATAANTYTCNCSGLPALEPILCGNNFACTAASFTYNCQLIHVAYIVDGSVTPVTTNGGWIINGANSTNSSFTLSHSHGGQLIGMRMALYTGAITSITYSSTEIAPLQCTNIQQIRIDATYVDITCMIASGFGTNLSFIVHHCFDYYCVDTAPTVQTINYPWIIPVARSLRLLGLPLINGTDELKFDTYTGAHWITIDAINLGGPVTWQPGYSLRVYFGPYYRPTLYECTDAYIPAPYTSIICLTEYGAQGTGQAIHVHITTAQVFDALDFLSFPSDRPTISAVYGCDDTSGGVGTANCPTSGGNILTITATGYYEPVRVLIGGNDCPLIRPLFPVLRCILPAGTGIDQSVVVVAGPSLSDGARLLSYAVPTITMITGCTSVMGSNLTIINCPRNDTSQVLTLTGHNFGESDATVFVGTIPCVNTWHHANMSHEIVYCALPSGRGTDRPVLLLQDRGEESRDSDVTISYEPCALGWEDNQTLSTNDASRGCSPCEVGSYRDTQSLVACQSCSAGRYAANPGAITCDICADGTYADSTGFVTCSVCELPALVSGGKTACSLCDPGLGNIGGVCGGCPFGSAPIAGRCACSVGYYSTATASNDVPNCVACPEGASCPLGTTIDTLQAQVGWWRSNLTLTYLRCVRPAHCVGGPESMQCQANREGPLCVLCRDGYRGDATTDECKACVKNSSVGGEIAGLSLAALVAFILLLVWVWRTADRQHITRVPQLLVAQEKRLFTARELRKIAEQSAQHDLTAVLKIIVAFAQIATNLSEDAEFRWPQNFYAFVSWFSWMQFDLIAVDEASCGLSVNYFDKLLVVAITPIVVLLLMMAAFYGVRMYMDHQHGEALRDAIKRFNKYGSEPGIVHRGATVADVTNFDDIAERLGDEEQRELDDEANGGGHGRARSRGASFATRQRQQMTVQAYVIQRAEWKAKWVRSSLFVLFLFFPAVSSRVLAFFECRSIDGDSLLVADYTISCNSDLWQQYLPVAIAFTLIYPVGIPLLFLILLVRVINRRRLRHPLVRMRLGFLYEAYHFDVAWFEVLEVLHKLFLTSLVGLMPLGSRMQIGLAVSCVYTVAILLVNPYRRVTDHRMHFLSQVEISLILLSAVVWQSVGYTDSGPLALTDLAVSVVLLVLMICLFCLFAWHFFLFARDRSKQLTRFMAANEDTCNQWCALYCHASCLCCCTRAARYQRRHQRQRSSKQLQPNQSQQQQHDNNDTELMSGTSISSSASLPPSSAMVHDGDSKRTSQQVPNQRDDGDGDITPSESIDDISLFR